MRPSGPSRPPIAHVLPKEHGTWAMLLVPWAVGCGVAGRVEARQLLLLASAVSLFLAHTHFMRWVRLYVGARSDPSAVAAARRLFQVFAAVGAALSVPLLTRRLAGLVLFGAVAGVLVAVSSWLVAKRLDHALPGQTLAAVGLSLASPAADYVARGVLGPRALALWLLNAAFFLWAVLYVRLKIEARARRVPLTSAAERFAFARGMLAMDAVLLLGALLALLLGSFSTLALWAFLPAVAQAVVGIVRLDRPAPLKRVGILVTAHSILWAILVIWLADCWSA
jgi:YwiC-like protein